MVFAQKPKPNRVPGIIIVPNITTKLDAGTNRRRLFFGPRLIVSIAFFAPASPTSKKLCGLGRTGFIATNSTFKGDG